MELFKLFGTIAIKNSDANEEIDETTKKAEKSSGKIGSAFSKIGGFVASAFAVDKIKDFGLSCLDAAADANAATSQFSQVFGDMEGKATDSLRAIADNTGIQFNRMKGSYTGIAAFAKTTGMDTASALGLADRAMIAVADSAAFYDRSLEDTTESLRSFLKGNFENDAALGLSCTETTRNAAANKLYGKSFKDLSEEQKQLTLLQMVEDANKLSGALGQAARESDTWSNQTGNLKQAIKDLMSVLGNKVLPQAVDLVKKAAGGVQKVSDNMPQIIQTFKDWLPVLGGVGTALITVKSGLAISGMITAVTASWNAYKLANEGATVAQWLLNAAMGANPIVLLVGLLAGLVAAIVVLWNTNEDFRKKVIEIWNAIKKAFSEAIEAIKTFMTNLGAKFDEIKGKIGEWVSSTIKRFHDWQMGIERTIDNWSNNVKAKFNNWKSNLISTITGGLTSAYDTVTSKLNAIKDKFTSIFDKAKSIVKGAIDKIKGFFNFSWSLPHLKLPHISISGKFSLKPPSVPKFGISWYKKAMNEPYMMESPTVFGVNPMTGQLKAGGEAGDEMIYGKQNLLNDIRFVVAQQNTTLTDKLDILIDLLSVFLPKLLEHTDKKIVMDSGTLVGELISKIDEELGRIYKERERGTI